MRTYDGNALTARFAALAPDPLPGSWEDVRHRAGVTRKSWRRLVVAFAVVAVAGMAVTALFVSSPWKGSPGFLEPAQAARFLERAEAALTPPEGTILHYKLELSRTSTRFGCTVTGPYEMWVDLAPPHRWRAITTQLTPPDPAVVESADPRMLACTDWGTHEVGAPSNMLGTLLFVPPSTLRVAPVQEKHLFVDSVQMIREEIRRARADGRAHNEGVTEIDGRAVVRYRLDCVRTPCPSPSYVYINPETYLPVKVEEFGNTRIVLDEKRVLIFNSVERWLTIEYLPRTPENLALTDIRAQHPDATGP